MKKKKVESYEKHIFDFQILDSNLGLKANLGLDLLGNMENSLENFQNFGNMGKKFDTFQ